MFRRGKDDARLRTGRDVCVCRMKTEDTAEGKMPKKCCVAKIERLCNIESAGWVLLGHDATEDKVTNS